ncbi:Zinc-binding oxidoreductase [Lasiodiplodia theobromae]|uniref:Zinc-binding oxidoreductase n=1 Tax=Lasiodiplodia theobromae TaxID=45133 RepID=UPI0015C2D3A8|nr:Zinc-binding oxidoreductase [Lasiodiplodia theobromae]KAF4543480.1 Zinc-binding oxidoreductase [Lasiodiplodia theobromae]
MATTTTKTQRAIVVLSRSHAALISDRPLPHHLRPSHLAIAVSHVALNPTDWKSIDLRGEPGLLSGCDYSGVVEAVGANVTEFAVGDRVAGVAHGCNASNPEDGAFAEHIVARAALAMKVPAGVMGMAEAATVPVGVTTVAQGLYQSLGLPWPATTTEGEKGEGKQKEGGFPVLVYGGSTATGTLAIQFAKLSGCTVLTTCSPRNFELVKGLGADQVFDYREPGVGKRIREAAGDRLAHVFDCISLPASVAICAEAFGREGGKYSALLYIDGFPREDVEVEVTMAYTAFGQEYRQNDKVTPAKPQDLEYAARFWKVAGELLAQGKIKPHPAEVREGGLEGILDGLEDMKQDKVSGVKLVYKVQDV